MMNIKRELQMNKLALAALLLGVFSLNPMARAEEPAAPAAAPVAAAAPAAAPAEPELPASEVEELPEAKRDGLKWSELRTLSGNSFTIRVDNDMVIFSGSIPKGCAPGRSMSEISSDTGKHALSINLPNCPAGNTSKLNADGKKMVRVDAAFPAKSFNGQDGKFCLNYSQTGDGEFSCDPIMVSGKQLEHRSLATIATETQRVEQEAAKKLRIEERRKKEERLIKQVGLYCAQGNFHAIGLELEAAADFLGDLTQVLEQIGKTKLKRAEQALKKAKDPEELKVAYEALVAEGFDAEDALKTYVTRRLEMGKELVAGRAKSVSDVESGIRDLEADLRDVDVFEENKAAITWLFVELGNRLRDDKDYDGAEGQYKKAMMTADLKGKIKIEQEMAKMFLAAAEACQEENKTKLAKCDALAKKAEKHMNGAIALQGRVKGEDALAELNGMKAEKIQQFGISVVKVKVAGYGEYNPYGGAFAQRKQQMYQTGMQELYMQRMMQQQLGGAGMQNVNGQSGGFFR